MDGADLYFLNKAMHLIAMVAWFAGIFYMFRLFVYHTENKDKPEITALLKIMARRLYYYITVPAMVATFVFGLLMPILNPYLWKQPWFHVKLTLVILLAGYTGYVGKTRRRYEKDDVYLTSKQCRILNEVPTIFLILIIFVVIFRYKFGS